MVNKETAKKWIREGYGIQNAVIDEVQEQIDANPQIWPPADPVLPPITMFPITLTKYLPTCGWRPLLESKS